MEHLVVAARRNIGHVVLRIDKSEPRTAREPQELDLNRVYDPGTIKLVRGAIDEIRASGPVIYKMVD